MLDRGKDNPIITQVFTGFALYHRTMNKVQEPATSFQDYMAQYLKAPQPTESVEIDNLQLLQFKGGKQAKTFAERFAEAIVDESTFTVTITTEEKSRFDQAVTVAQMLKPMADILFDSDLIGKINIGQYHDHFRTEADKFTPEQLQHLTRAKSAIIRFLYNSTIRDANLQVPLAEQIGNGQKIFALLSQNFQEIIAKHGKRVNQTHWKAAFETGILSEYEAMALVHQRLAQDPNVAKFDLHVSKIDEDLFEATDFRATIAYQDNRQEQIRYQVKLQSLVRKGNTLSMRSKNGNVPVPPEFQSSTETLIAPNRQTQTFSLESFADISVSPFIFFNYLEAIGHDKTLELLRSNITKDRIANQNSETTYLSGWVIISRKITT